MSHNCCVRCVRLQCTSQWGAAPAVFGGHMQRTQWKFESFILWWWVVVGNLSRVLKNQWQMTSCSLLAGYHFCFDNKSKTLRHGVLSLLESANSHNDATRERDAIWDNKVSTTMRLNLQRSVTVTKPPFPDREKSVHYTLWPANKSLATHVGESALLKRLLNTSVVTTACKYHLQGRCNSQLELCSESLSNFQFLQCLSLFQAAQKQCAHFASGLLRP